MSRGALGSILKTTFSHIKKTINKNLKLRTSLKVDIDFDTLKAEIKKHDSIHLGKKFISPDMIALSFIYDKRSLNSWKIMNAYIYRFKTESKQSFFKIKFTQYLFHIYSFFGLFLAIAFSVTLAIEFQNSLIVLIGFMAWVCLLGPFYLYFKFILGEQSKRLVKELKELVNNTA